MRTSSPRRWIWIRIPSSLNSTDASSIPSRASATVAPVDASMGRMGRKISKPTALSPSSPPVMAIRAISVRSPESMSARRAIAPGTAAALATASAMTPARAPCRRPPVSRPTRKVASGSVARPSSASRSSRRRAADPVPVAAWTSEIAPSTSSMLSDGSAAGGRLMPRMVT